ncbi:MAG TPA: hypothetical protein VGQ36_00580 [Thermoanaerobaculia bacterium]|jgi:hypothetical protein|nr:hypothetical protein [Thermoanaerobaculia bacterium]
MRESGSAAERTGAPRTDLIALAILTALITLLFIDVLLGINAMYIRDIAHAAYPARLMLRETVLSGDFPYWNRWISAGQPMAANPAHAVFYPLTWLILLPKFELGFNLMLLLHIYIAGWGMYALLRSMRAGAPAAFFGALSFALGGACLSILDLLPLLMSFAWLPLTCLFGRRFLLSGARRDFALAALFFGIQALVGEVAILLQTGIVLGIYSLRHGVRGVARVGIIAVFAVLIGAVQMVPAFDHAGDSVRAQGFTFDQVTSWSLPLPRLGELLHPNLLGHHVLNGRRVYWGGVLYPDRGIPFIRTIYPGMIVITLAIAGLIAGVRGRAVFVGITLTSLLLALGAHTPLWRLLYEIGLARAIRYPEKFLLMGIFAVTVFGAIVLDRMLAGDERLARIARATVVAIALILGAIAAVAATPVYARIFTGLWNPPGHVLSEMLAASRSGWILAALRAALLFLILRNLTRLRRTIGLALLGVLLLLDLGTLLPELAPRVSPAFFREPPLVARQLPGDRDEWRLFHVAAWQIRSSAAYFTPKPDLYWVHRNAMYPMMPAAWGIRTVIEPDFDKTTLLPTADFAKAVWALSNKRPDWLGVTASMSNAWFAAVYVNPYEAAVKAHHEARKLEPVRLIELEPSPRYFFADQLVSIRGKDDFVEKLVRADASPHAAFIAGPSFAPAPGLVRRVHERASSSRIEVETRGRAFLVMSVTPHKYWRITVDGANAPAVVTNVGYQGVVIPGAGRHLVEMRYRNPLIPVGAAISLLTALALVLIARR